MAGGEEAALTTRLVRCRDACWGQESLSEGRQEWAPQFRLSFGERASSYQKDKREPKTGSFSGPGLHSCCAGEANSRQTKKIRTFPKEALHRPPAVRGAGLSRMTWVWFGGCVTSQIDPQRGESVGRTQLFLAETARAHTPFLPVSSLPCALTPGLPDARATPGPSRPAGLALVAWGILRGLCGAAPGVTPPSRAQQSRTPTPGTSQRETATCFYPGGQHIAPMEN